MSTINATDSHHLCKPRVISSLLEQETMRSRFTRSTIALVHGSGMVQEQSLGILDVLSADCVFLMSLCSTSCVQILSLHTGG